MKYYRWNGFCLCDAGGGCPEGAAGTSEPFAPLLFTVRRNPGSSRGIYRIRSISELSEPEDVEILRISQAQNDCSALAELVEAEGACVVNTAFGRCFDQLHAICSRKRNGLRVNLAGLGDVGGTVLTGLVLLGEELAEIGIYDPRQELCRRYELEMNQILPTLPGRVMPQVFCCPKEKLFDCDALLFTASRGVPAVGAEGTDVRMAQYEKNREMLLEYAQLARRASFRGLFAQISDPVDLLCRSVFLESNRGPSGAQDWNGLLPEQLQGYGLGVMHARADYYAGKMGINCERVFGPHGQALVAANATDEGYNDAASCALTEAVLHANLEIRALGYKPYIAPGLSSAAISVLQTLRGQWHDGAVAVDGAYFGCRNRLTEQGMETERLSICPALMERLKAAHRALREFDNGK